MNETIDKEKGEKMAFLSDNIYAGEGGRKGEKGSNGRGRKGGKLNARETAGGTRPDTRAKTVRQRSKFFDLSLSLSQSGLFQAPST